MSVPKTGGNWGCCHHKSRHPEPCRYTLSLPRRQHRPLRAVPTKLPHLVVLEHVASLAGVRCHRFSSSRGCPLGSEEPFLRARIRHQRIGLIAKILLKRCFLVRLGPHKAPDQVRSVGLFAAGFRQIFSRKFAVVCVETSGCRTSLPCFPVPIWP